MRFELKAIPPDDSAQWITFQRPDENTTLAAVRADLMGFNESVSTEQS